MPLEGSTVHMAKQITRGNHYRMPTMEERHRPLAKRRRVLLMVCCLLAVALSAGVAALALPALLANGEPQTIEKTM